MNRQKATFIFDFGFWILDSDRPIQNLKSKIQNAIGFTLVELMLVIVIIGVLAAMVVPRLAGRTEQAKIARAKADVASIGLALDLYELDTGKYPAESDLKALTEKTAPSDLSEDAQKRFSGPYLKKGLPKDPWGRDYNYKSPSDHNQDYDLWSAGSNGQPGDNDDVSNWQ